MVKKGYKQTEVGIIPNTWQVISLQNLCVQNGIVRGPFGGALKKEIFVAEGYKVYEQGNAIYKTVTRGSYYIDAAKYNKMLRFSVQEGDFIVSCSGTIGMIFQIPINAPKGIINQALLKLTINDAVVNPQYFYLYFSCDSFTRRIVDDTQGGAMKNLVGMDVFRNTPFPIPPMPEQKNISIVLAAITDLITNLEAIIAKKKAIKQGTMQELLTGKKRLPGFSGDWIKSNIGSCIIEKPSYGINAPAVDFNGFLPRYIRITDISEDGRYCKDAQASVSAENVEPFLLKTNDIVLARTGASVGKSYIYDEHDGRLVYAGFLIKMSIDPQKADSRFIFSVFHTYDYWKWVAQTSMRSGQPGINGEEYASYEFRMPSDLKEQKAIADILTNMDNEIVTLGKKLIKYRQVKQGMMQQLLTGKIRLV